MDLTSIPKHVAIIMDGNGRWAIQKGFPRIEGHRKGAETIENIVEAASNMGIKYLTLYAFSYENWQRPSEEVEALMALLRIYLSEKREKMVKKGIRFMTIGEKELLSDDLRQEISKTADATKDCKKMTLIVALSYGARQEICRAFAKMMKSGKKILTPDSFSSLLDTAGVPDPDLLIRTSGEFRISNFLLWQLAYTELYFTETLWPDFDEKELAKAVKEYQMRERRFGMTSEQL